ncbi:MAG: hypothetical protein K8L97_28050 [Anaerolineae bacterium]|nr:hypothetical protein [Anaerolineae bacterium]
MSEAAGGHKCAYTRLENGIHEFVFQDSSKATIDEFFRILEGILTTTPKTETARYIVDVSQSDGVASLVAGAQRFRRMETQMPQRARGRTVVLHTSGGVLGFIDNFVRALAPSRDITRFFPVDKREEAVEWLLSDNR